METLTFGAFHWFIAGCFQSKFNFNLFLISRTEITVRPIILLPVEEAA
jgi:hypothetical protein